jgi:hypothetical protein
MAKSPAEANLNFGNPREAEADPNTVPFAFGFGY